MAIAFVNATRGGGSASDNNWTCTAASHTTGNLIVVHVKHEGAATTINSITDTAGNTYTPLTYRSHSNGDLHGQIWYAKNITGNASNVLTIDMAASRAWRAVQILQYSGCDTTSPFDQENWGEIASGTSLTTGNVTTTQADEVLVAFSGDYNGNTYTAGTDFTERLDLNNSPAGAYGAAEDRIVSATGTYSGAMTQSASAANILLLATFKAASTNKTLAADSGSYTFTGTAATPKVARKVVAAAGSYSFTGTAATLKVGFKVAANSGSYSFSGTAASLLHNWKLSAEAGSYSFTGSDATLTKTAGKTLAADAGSYSFSGTNASLLVGKKVAAGGGSYSFTGTNVSLNKGATLPAGGGSYAFSGSAASLLVNKLLPAENGIYLFSGSSANLIHSSATLGGGRRKREPGYTPIRLRRIVEEPFPLPDLKTPEPQIADVVVPPPNFGKAIDQLIKMPPAVPASKTDTLKAIERPDEDDDEEAIIIAMSL